MSTASSRSTSIDWAGASPAWRPAGTGIRTSPDLPVVLEPGRFLVGPAGVVLARGLDVKEVGDRAVAILDAGMHTALRPALVGAGHRLHLLTSEERQTGEVIAAGPLCTGLDVFPEQLDRIPLIGDLVAIGDLGAYGFSESMPLFLSHPVAAEIGVRQGQVLASGHRAAYAGGA